MQTLAGTSFHLPRDEEQHYWALLGQGDLYYVQHCLVSEQKGGYLPGGMLWNNMARKGFKGSLLSLASLLLLLLQELESWLELIFSPHL